MTIAKTKDRLSDEISQITSKYDEVSEEYNKLSKKLISLRDKREKLQAQLDEQIIQEMGRASAEDQLQYYLHCSFDETRVKHKASEEFFKDVYGLSSHGYFPETNTKALMIYMKRDTKDEDLESLAKKWDEVIIYQKPTEEDRDRYLHILDEDCSESGIIRLTYNTESKKYAITKTVYSRTNVVKAFESMIEACRYIRKYHSNGD